MINTYRFARTLILCVLSAGSIPKVSYGQDASAGKQRSVNVVVMDPLSLPLSCACVPGVGQRRYEPLIEQIQSAIGTPVNLLYEESLQLALRRGLNRIDIVIGKRSVVLSDALETRLSFTPVAALTDHRGRKEMTGVLLVAKDGPITRLGELAGKKVAIGSSEHAECHALAKELFRIHNIDAEWVDRGSIESAVYAFADHEADAVVVSDYFPPLLEGCGKLEKDASRSIAQTNPCAGVQVFFATDLPDSLRNDLMSALQVAGSDESIRQSLESRDGFVLLTDRDDREPSDLWWTDWRGQDRSGQFPSLPKSLSEKPDVLWRSEVTGPAMAGLSATNRWVIVADKSADFKQDVYRAFDATTGEPVWTIRLDASKRMEYTNAPRATPVIVGRRVLLQSVFGQLLCCDLATGKELWKRHLVDDFGGKVPTWGYSVPPLVVGDRVVISPGSATASVAAIELQSGETIWKTAGHAPAYAPFIHGVFGGRDQLIGYDAAGLGGWDVQTGERLWELIPPDNSDFHVGTPVKFGDGILLATENNGTRFYQFSADGKIDTNPAAENLDCAPDTCTPVVVSQRDRERIYCTAYGELFCIDGSDDLQTIWSETDERFYDHTCLIAGNGRVLLWGTECDLLLIDATIDAMKIVSQWRPMNGKHPESMSHPAIVGNRLYLRSQSELICIRLSTTEP